MTKISLYEFNSKNFKKDGTLAKRAKGVSYVMDEATSDGYTKIAGLIKEHVEGIVSINTPYFFNHIVIHAEAPNEVGGKKTFMVFEDAFVNGHQLMTSPTKLLEALKA